MWPRKIAKQNPAECEVTRIKGFPLYKEAPESLPPSEDTARRHQVWPRKRALEVVIWCLDLRLSASELFQNMVLRSTICCCSLSLSHVTGTLSKHETVSLWKSHTIILILVLALYPIEYLNFFFALKFLNLLRGITNKCEEHIFNLAFLPVYFNGLCLKGFLNFSMFGL